MTLQKAKIYFQVRSTNSYFLILRLFFFKYCNYTFIILKSVFFSRYDIIVVFLNSGHNIAANNRHISIYKDMSGMSDHFLKLLHRSSRYENVALFLVLLYGIIYSGLYIYFMKFKTVFSSFCYIYKFFCLLLRK